MRGCWWSTPSLLAAIPPIREQSAASASTCSWRGGEAPGTCALESARCAKPSPRLEPADTSKDDAAFWLYSSGTTGFPKGADPPAPRHARRRPTSTPSRPSACGSRDVSFSVAKLFFAYGLGNGLYFPLRAGGDDGAAARPAHAGEGLRGDRPLPADRVLQRADQLRGPAAPGREDGPDEPGPGAAVRVGRRAAAQAIYEKWLDRFGVEILDGIGSTEILHIFISNRPGQVRPGSTGQIVPGYEAKIVDDDGRELRPGEVGTLLIKGDSIAAGYWNKHEQTKSTFRGEWINTHDKFLRRRRRLLLVRRPDRRHDEGQRPGRLAQPTWRAAPGHPAVLESGVVGVTDRTA